MAKFTTRFHREHDEQGRLTAAGFYWTETRWWVGIPAALLFIGGGIVAVIVAATSPYEDLIPALFLCLCELVAAWTINEVFGQRACAVIFEQGGVIDTPFGFPGYRLRRRMNGSHANISSIERVQLTPQYFAVHIYSVGGDAIHLASSSNLWDAHKIVVQVNRALEEIRAASSAARLNVSPDRAIA